MQAETQSDFIAAVMDPSRPAIQNACDPKGRYAPKRFAVYRNNVIVSLTEAIEQGFPLCRRLVGDEFFKAMAREFALKNPPRSPLMFEYGGEFSQFIEGFAPASEVPYLADMARLEYARRMSYFAADAQYRDLTKFSALKEAEVLQMSLTLHPSLFIVASRFPIFDIYNKLTSQGAIGTGGQIVVSYRKDDLVHSVLANASFARLCEALKENSFGAAVEQASLQNAKAMDQSIALALQLSIDHE